MSWGWIKRWIKETNVKDCPKCGGHNDYAKRTVELMDGSVVTHTYCKNCAYGAEGRGWV